MRDNTGNLPPLPGIFPDYMAPVVRNAPDGVRELAMLRWGMPGPPQFGGSPITNIRNTKSPHWRRWLKPENRCVVPWTSFCEYADTKPKKTPTWFAFKRDRPLAVFHPKICLEQQEHRHGHRKQGGCAREHCELRHLQG
jgi:putative SOS response-associated peptidase YedK